MKKNYSAPAIEVQGISVNTCILTDSAHIGYSGSNSGDDGPRESESREQTFLPEFIFDD